MTGSRTLEQRYRRLLASYPRAFRQECEDEMLAVLMAAAGDARQRPGLADSADLIRNGLWMRLRPGAPRSARTVFWAVRLLVLSAALELAALVVVLATRGNLRAAIIRRFPHFTAAQWHASVHAHILPVEIGAPIAAAGCLWMAWANGRGYRWARGLSLGFFGLTSLSLLSSVAQHSATFAPADLLAGCAVWFVVLVAVVLAFSSPSDQHYGKRRPDRGRQAVQRPAIG